MARPKLTVPSYRRHRDRTRDRAFVQIDGRRMYLGDWRSDSKERCGCFSGAPGRHPPAGGLFLAVALAGGSAIKWLLR